MGEQTHHGGGRDEQNPGARWPADLESTLQASERLRLKTKSGTGELLQRLRTLVALAKDLSSVPGMAACNQL